VSSEEISGCKEELTLRFEGKKLDKKDWFGKSDPYLSFYRRNADGSTTIVHRTEYIRNTLNPKWTEVKLEAKSLCSGDYERWVNNLSLTVVLICMFVHFLKTNSCAVLWLEPIRKWRFNWWFHDHSERDVESQANTPACCIWGDFSKKYFIGKCKQASNICIGLFFICTIKLGWLLYWNAHWTS